VTDFVARVGTADGSVVEQRHRAISETALRRELEAKGLHVFAVKAARTRLQLALPTRRERFNSLEFLVFNQQLATLLKAGVPVLQSLELLQGAQSNPYLREVLARVLGDVKSGIALSEAFAAQGEQFPRLYCTTLMSGERSGELVSVLRRYIQHQQMLETVRRRVTSALTYPAVLLGLAFGLGTLLFVYVIPRFATFYMGFAGDLPLITRLVIETATATRRLAPLLLGGVVVGGWFAHRWLRTDVGRQWLDSAKLKLPFIGGILHLFGLSQFVRSLATLLAGGTPMVEALETATSVVTNRAIGTPLARVAPRVREGQALWSSLTATGLFPELSLAMIQVGEATGALEEMLFNVGQFYDETIEVKLARVVTLIEPAVLVLMGGLIGILLLSVYVPMFRMIQYAR
jgi:type IV pilus assembly protein PilC